MKDIELEEIVNALLTIAGGRGLQPEGLEALTDAVREGLADIAAAIREQQTDS